MPFCLFALKFRLFAMRVSFFRMALFRLFAWRFFVFSHGVFTSFRVASFHREKTKGRNGTIQPPYKLDKSRCIRRLFGFLFSSLSYLFFPPSQEDGSI